MSYPDGATGFALLLMRLSYALTVFPTLGGLWPTHASWLPAVPAAILCIALMVGAATRSATLLLICALTINLFTVSCETALWLVASLGGASALLLLGPGAYSVDAHRFGRRVIRLEPRSPDRGDDG